MNIFVSGATGFIGSHLIKQLLKLGHSITVNLRPGKETSFNSNVKTHTLGKGDIESDIDFFRREDFDGIIHLASLYITNHKSYEVSDLIDSNVKFGSYLLECASKASVNWFINTGTFWQNYQDEDYSPVNLYAATKQAFESIMQFYSETNQIKTCTLRLSDTFGQNDPRPKIFSLWERIAKSGETLPMSQGEQIIDINHISNVVHAFITLAGHLQNEPWNIKSGAVYALNAEKRYSLKELSIIFERVMETKLNIAWGDLDYREREVMVPWSKGVSIPDYFPVVTIEEGLKELKWKY
ncbi:NAD-dependent epimerase/dehydratase family protein [Flagellimonas lutimaris]|uniref:NAD-dependent epimerase/dehydratase family protein n=1 Tax=Flagellimonas lutimaris TaxID=475082 RepID=UPI0039C30C61|tara:strand:- start:10646 stop:11533 length:888 start_codon:yes stop_codon:yes gene_type:complete